LIIAVTYPVVFVWLRNDPVIWTDGLLCSQNPRFLNTHNVM